MADQTLRTANASAVRHFGKRLQVFGSEPTSSNGSPSLVGTPPHSVAPNRPDTMRERFAAFLWDSTPSPASTVKPKTTDEPKPIRSRSVVPSPSPVVPSTQGGEIVVSPSKRSPSQSPPSPQKLSPPGQYGITSPILQQKSPPEPLVFNFKGYDAPSPLTSPPSTSRPKTANVLRPSSSPSHDAPSDTTRIVKSSSGGIAIRASPELRSEITSTTTRNPHPMFMEVTLAHRPSTARQGASRDVSFLAERRPSTTRSVSRTPSASPGQAVRSLSQPALEPYMDPEANSKGKSSDIPQTRIPEQFHILQTSDKPPEEDSGPLWQQLSDTKWVRQVFPEFHPTGRHQALMLGDALASMLEELESKKLKLTSLDAVKSAQNIYSSCFFEILRQVSVQCIERGNVLKAVWQSYEKLFAKVSEAADEDLAALRAVIEQMKLDHRAEIQGLFDRIDELHTVIRGKDGMIATLRAAVVDAERRAAEAADQWNKDKQGMLDRLLAAQNELTHVLADRNAQGDRYSKMMADLQARLEAAHNENASLRQQLVDERLASEARIKALQSQLEDTLRQLSDMRAILNRDKCEAGTQTDVVLPQLPATSSDDEDGIHMSASVRPRRKFKPKSNVSKQVVGPMAEKMVMRMLLGIYKDKMAADAVDDAINNRRQNMQEYVADWFLNRHGIKSIADNMVAKFKKGLKAYRSSNGYCDTFGRFWGVFAPGDTWSEQQLDMYLMILGHCMSAKGDPIHVIFDVANKIKLSVVLTVVDTVFGATIVGQDMIRLKKRVEALAVVDRAVGLEKYVDQDDSLRVCLDEWRQFNDRIRSSLRSIFRAADANGSNSLDWPEFLALVQHMDVGIPEDKAAKLHSSYAFDGEISEEGFVQIIMKAGVVSLGNPVPAAFLTVAAVSPEVSFDNLKREWESKRDSVLSHLASLPYVEPVMSPSHHTVSDRRTLLEERVSMLDHLLRTDSVGEVDTGWMCYRILMGEVKLAVSSP